MTINLREALRARGTTFHDLRLLARMKKNEVAEVLGRHESTIRRWNQLNAYPDWAMKLMAHHAGFLIHTGWEGWFIEDGLLYHPELKHGFTAQDVAILGWVRHGSNICRSCTRSVLPKL